MFLFPRESCQENLDLHLFLLSGLSSPLFASLYFVSSKILESGISVEGSQHFFTFEANTLSHHGAVAV